ncbi:MAG TPA: serine/threonine protein kinase [Candidatus Melainabacteria bacterium]|nr:serine/threonine protein kinase [Candidatus Melainabacteria bacterium]
MEQEPTQPNLEKAAAGDNSPFEVGKVLDGKYEVVSLLGKGGMGAVYRVRHKLLNIELALKTLDTQRLSDASSSRRFQTEAKAAFSLKHANLVKVHDFGVLEDGHPFLVMDLVQGKTLQELIKARGQLSLEEIEPIFTQLCFGLSHAHHQQVVHRDIKPANIMIVDGMNLKDEGSVKVLDFGIAKIVNEDRSELDALTQTGEIFGSPFYMSPEQCAGEAIDQRSDIYSLGCVLFEAITGTPPLVGSNPLRTMMLHVNEKAPSLKEAALGSHFPPAIEKVVSRMLAKSPSERYGDLGVVALELNKACTNLSTDSNQPSKDSSDDALVRKRTVSFSLLQLTAIVASVALVTIFSTLFISHFLIDSANAAAERHKEQFKIERISDTRIRETGDQKKLEEIEQYRKSFEKVSRISAVPYTENGVAKRLVVFPTMRCGSTRHGVSDVEGVRSIDKQIAIGNRIFPATGPLMFNVNEELDSNALANPSIYDKIDPTLFSGIDYEGLVFVSQGRVDGDTSAPGVLHLFNTLAKWKNLELINFRDVELKNDVVRILNRFPKLNCLVLHTPGYDGKFIAQQPFFKKIDRLIVIHGDVSPLLTALSHTHTIRKLSIGNHAYYSAQAAASLRNCTLIENLHLNQSKYEDDVVRAFSELTNVHRLSFNVNTLSPKQKEMFKKNWILLGPSAHSGYQITDIYAARNKPH